MEVDLPNILKRCSSAPVFAEENGPISNKNENVDVTSSKLNHYEKQSSENSISTVQNNLIQEKIISSLSEKNNANIYTNSYLNLSPSIQSSSACSSPVRSREASPAPFNIFAPRARRYSASFAGSIANNGANGPRLTPRVSQLRQEECVDANSREVNHEREVHSAMQMSQSWEDLTLVAENWSCKSEDSNNPLPANNFLTSRQCSSPSPTRRTFATRRSMSPIAMRPSQLGPVKRKFELEDGNWNINYSPPPAKKKLSHVGCGSPSEVFNLPSPCQNGQMDSGTPDGCPTFKLNIKLHANDVDITQPISSPTIPPFNENSEAETVSPTNPINHFGNINKTNGVFKNEKDDKSQNDKNEDAETFENNINFIGGADLDHSSICSRSDNRKNTLLNTVSKEKD
ncbi:P2R1A-PPP2R2A-interacting phosphatase regulator 1 isoform X2 [Condylostylus longicornis]|uniref:P2R1A-PPP2R2A-interacting phosphatase regulator 1 isoform X2 n=1 Tax=Condylostylus longicornis TaxID=2530218 RepID=UPI00244E2BE7|nr:P2R1A-PPP2R2A-interacting phosphatase regulator 1 isoform X2 [Condylostylus longicornis]